MENIKEVAALGAAALANLLALVWHASNAMARLRGHEARIARLEERADDHAARLDALMSDVKERLARIEATLDILASKPPIRR